jgi:hypothetical protein
MSDRPPDIYENFVPNEDIQEFMDEEIRHAPHAPSELRHRLENNSESPQLSGGDIDASWEEAEDDGAEAFAGHNPTPDQSDVEANAAAMGFNFEDNQEIDLLEKMRRRDRKRFELDEDSKAAGDMI